MQLVQNWAGMFARIVSYAALPCFIESTLPLHAKEKTLSQRLGSPYRALNRVFLVLKENFL